MEGILKNGLVVLFFVIGVVVSIISGLMGRTDMFAVFYKSILSGVVMGLLGAGLVLFLKRNLSEEDFNKIFKTSRSDNYESNNENETNFDATDDSAINPSELYNNASDTDTTVESHDLGGYNSYSGGEGLTDNTAAPKKDQKKKIVMKDKVLKADTETLAKAIHTVMSRDK